ncbi:phage portal protein family protein [Tomitella gaofuii]|uniref:phage portal protein family protein n=1 Tax=Tomitella gaofuii TaxID=2760083 RepID=UPI0015F819B8|nr:DUF935 family protein [Tomitella gaofuii]
MAEATAPAPLSEIGYAAGGNGSASSIDDETTPELRWPANLPVYNRMRREDAQVISVLRAITLPLKRTVWRVDPNGARDEVVQHVADDLNLPIVGQPERNTGRTRGRFSWNEHLDQALLMMPYGHMFFEQVYRIDEANRVRLRKLAPRMPLSIQEIEVARDGGLEWIEQTRDMRAVTGRRVRIPVSRLVAYVCDKEGADWTGNSVLRQCYAPWMIKNAMLRLAPQVVQRNGMGVPIYEAPAGASDADIAKGRKMASDFQAGRRAGGAVPSGAKLSLLGISGNLPDPMPLIVYSDAQIGKSVLAHFLNLDGKGGSYALAGTQADAFVQSLQTRAAYIQSVANAHIVEDLVDVNFGLDERAPRLVFDEIGARHAATAEALKALRDGGLIFPDRPLEEFLRQMYGLPPMALPPEPGTSGRESTTPSEGDES